MLDNKRASLYATIVNSLYGMRVAYTTLPEEKDFLDMLKQNDRLATAEAISIMQRVMTEMRQRATVAQQALDELQQLT